MVLCVLRLVLQTLGVVVGVPLVLCVLDSGVLDLLPDPLVGVRQHVHSKVVLELGFPLILFILDSSVVVSPLVLRHLLRQRGVEDIVLDLVLRLILHLVKYGIVYLRHCASSTHSSSNVWKTQPCTVNLL